MDSILLTIGKAMIASFWWIAAIAAVLAVALLLARRATPERRHGMAAAMLLAVPVVFAMAVDMGGPAGPGGARLVPLLRELPALPPMGDARTIEWARPAAWVWFAGVLLLSLRTLGGWMHLRMLIARAKPMEWASLPALCERVGLRGTVSLRTSVRADSPFTAGWRRPVVVVPLATLAGLPADQFEAILLHELAHIRRGDYMGEWALHALETVFFYHPAIWWMTAVVRREREQCCDDIAIQAGASRIDYAKALLTLEELRVPALANGGAGSGLQTRIERVLGMAPKVSPWPAMAAIVLAAGGMITPMLLAQPMGPYAKWLNEDVFYIIQPQERTAFESLRTDEEREQFIVQFWQRRDPTPTTPHENEAKEEHYRRISYSNERYRETDTPGWRTKRGRTYIVFGPPDEIESHPRDNFEQWMYHNIPGVGEKVIFQFGTRPSRR